MVNATAAAEARKKLEIDLLHLLLIYQRDTGLCPCRVDVQTEESRRLDGARATGVARVRVTVKAM
jgi:hypothetical protein